MTQNDREVTVTMTVDQLDDIIDTIDGACMRSCTYGCDCHELTNMLTAQRPQETDE
jgi:hypothetical protein